MYVVFGSCLIAKALGSNSIMSFILRQVTQIRLIYILHIQGLTY